MDGRDGFLALGEGSDHGVVHEESGVLDLTKESLGVAEMAGWGNGRESQEPSRCEVVSVEARGYNVGVKTLEFRHVCKGR